MKNYNGHKTRYSDSSVYDEICIYCGATDAPGDSGLNKLCSKQHNKNRYGVDLAYFRKEFEKLSRDLENYTPNELSRYLKVLSEMANECKNKQFEKALEMACEFISEDADCPLVLFDTYPWIKPCEDVCNEGIESSECWKQYFLNKCEE